MRRLFIVSAIIYVLIYACEGAVRYGLYNIGRDDAILLRDLLMLLPLASLFVNQSFRARLHPALFAFAAAIALHGAIAMFNLGSYVPAIYGAKLLVNVLFGFLAERHLVQPERRTLTMFVMIWVITLTGVALDKFVCTFPWTGLETHIGGIRVDVSRGWDIEDSFEKRAAGFSRSSISAAMLLPVMAAIIAPRIGSFLLRAVMLILTLGGVLLTTQKGSVLALATVACVLLVPKWGRYSLMCFACMAFALLDVALPLVTSGLLIPQEGGVFSFGSFAMRIALTWPEAWQWIANHDVFPFGVGLGGIGGAQRFYAANFFNPSDNVFVYLYANFGMLSLLYLAWATSLGPRLPIPEQDEAVGALAVLTFLLGYGAALSILEDQVAALFLGAAAGAMWHARQRALGGAWANPYEGTPLLRPRTLRDAGIRRPWRVRHKVRHERGRQQLHTAARIARADGRAGSRETVVGDRMAGISVQSRGCRR